MDVWSASAFCPLPVAVVQVCEPPEPYVDPKAMGPPLIFPMAESCNRLRAVPGLGLDTDEKELPPMPSAPEALVPLQHPLGLHSGFDSSGLPPEGFHKPRVPPGHWLVLDDIGPPPGLPLPKGSFKPPAPAGPLVDTDYTEPPPVFRLPDSSVPLQPPPGGLDGCEPPPGLTVPEDFGGLRAPPGLDSSLHDVGPPPGLSLPEATGTMHPLPGLYSDLSKISPPPGIFLLEGPRARPEWQISADGQSEARGSPVVGASKMSDYGSGAAPTHAVTSRLRAEAQPFVPSEMLLSSGKDNSLAESFAPCLPFVPMAEVERAWQLWAVASPQGERGRQVARRGRQQARRSKAATVKKS